MRLARFDSGGSPRLGLAQAGRVHDLTAAGGGDDALAWLAQPAALREAQAARALQSPGLDPATLAWRLPVEQPGKLVCLGLNYSDHAAEGGNAVPEYPAFFLRATSSLLPAGAPMRRPRVSERLDWEAELAVVIGRRTRHCTQADALQAVAAYSLFNDGSVRDYQRKSTQWTIGKNFDATGGFGPWLVTPDELPPGAAGLRIQSRLNGQVMQDSDTGRMLVTVAHAITLLAECMTLEPGDVIAMGTPSGVGYARKPPVFMRPGDRIEIDIEGIGVLANPVEDEA